MKPKAKARHTPMDEKRTRTLPVKISVPAHTKKTNRSFEVMEVNGHTVALTKEPEICLYRAQKQKRS